jgi:REP element-mobilizing transposase RayT
MKEETALSAFAAIDEFSRYRRHLPHLQLHGSVYFCTASTKFRQTLSPEERDIVFEAIQFHRDRKYELFASVVMPDHFHLLLEPLQKDDSGLFNLSEIFHSIKSWSSNQIGKLRPQVSDRKKSPIWQDETYDHILRNDEDYSEKFYYTLYNPVEAGLVATPDEYKWLWYQGKLGR